MLDAIKTIDILTTLNLCLLWKSKVAENCHERNSVVDLITRLFTEGEYMVLDGVMVRHGKGTHVDGRETYIGQWQHDAMHGEGIL